MGKHFKAKQKKRLCDKVKNAIKSDSTLFAHLSDVLGIYPSAMNSTLIRNATALTQHHIVKMLSEQTGIPEDEILEDVIICDPLPLQTTE